MGSDSSVCQTSLLLPPVQATCHASVLLPLLSLPGSCLAQSTAQMSLSAPVHGPLEKTAHPELAPLTKLLTSADAQPVTQLVARAAGIGEHILNQGLSGHQFRAAQKAIQGVKACHSPRDWPELAMRPGTHRRQAAVTFCLERVVCRRFEECRPLPCRLCRPTSRAASASTRCASCSS